MAMSEVNTNYTIFISANNSFLDPAGRSNNGKKNPPTENRQWLYKPCLNPSVSWKCQDGTVSSYPPFADMPVRHAELFPIEKKKKQYWYLGISRMTASGIINRLEYVFTCFVAYINADSSNIQTNNLQTLYIWKRLTEFPPISLKFETVLFFNFTTCE
jgi:hypothetical protein